MTHFHYIISGGGFESLYLTNLLAGKLPHIYQTRLEQHDRVCLVHVDYGQIAASFELRAVRSQRAIFEDSIITTHKTNVTVLGLKLPYLFSEHEKRKCILFAEPGTNKTPELKYRNEKIIKGVAAWIEQNFDTENISNTTLYLGFEPKAQPYEDCTDEFLDRMYYELGSRFSLEAPLLDLFKTEEDYLKSLYEDKLYGKVWSCWTPKDLLPCGTCNHCIKHKKMWGTKNGLMVDYITIDRPFFDMPGLPT